MNNSKSIALSILVSAAALIYFLAPEEKLEKIHSALRTVTAPEVNECLDAWRYKFDNPDSIVYVESHKGSARGRNSLQVRYKAKNYLGASISNSLTCGLDSSGKFDYLETRKYITNKYYGLLDEVPRAAEPPQSNRQ